MKIKIKVTYIDGRVAEGVVLPRQFKDFEDEYKIGIPAWSAEPTMTGIYFLGYAVAKRMHKDGTHDGALKPTFDGFLDAIEDVDMEMEEDIPLDETAPSSE